MCGHSSGGWAPQSWGGSLRSPRGRVEGGSRAGRQGAEKTLPRVGGPTTHISSSQLSFSPLLLSVFFSQPTYCFQNGKSTKALTLFANIYLSGQKNPESKVCLLLAKCAIFSPYEILCSISRFKARCQLMGLNSPSISLITGSASLFSLWRNEETTSHV